MTGDSVAAALAYRGARLAVAVGCALVPSSYRKRFREEWWSELWHQRDRGAPAMEILARAGGVFRDALLTRRLLRENDSGLDAPGRPRGRSLMLASDLRLAVRSCLAHRLWTLVVLATLAVGIGANTAIFGLVQAVLLNPLRYPDPDRLVKITGVHVEEGDLSNLSPADFHDLAAESRSFASMGAHGWVGFFTIAGDAGPERVPGSNVTSGFFETLGTPPALGRMFTAADERPGAPATALVTDAFWRTRLGARPDALGQVLRIDAEPHEIVGVLPPEYTHPEPNPDREPLLYTLYRFDSEPPRSGRFLRGVGRLHPGSSLEEARGELAAIASRLEEIYPESNTDRGVRLVPLQEAIVAGSRRGLLVLYGAVGVVLLIVCANLANLQLAHGASRRRALAVHSALGAGRGRLVRQLLLESWLLAVAGGLLGFLLAASTRGLLAHRTIPRAVEVQFDFGVLAFALALSTATAVLFGLAPALSLSANGPRGVLVPGGSRGVSSRDGGRRFLVASEVALSLLLLVCAGLFLRSLFELRSVATGFRSESVSTLSMSLPLARYPEGDQIPFYQRLYERLRGIPGVEAVGGTNILPLTDNYSTDGFQIEGRPEPEGEKPGAEARSVGGDYFEAMGIPLLRGRLFDERDRTGSPGVVILSEAMARKFWGSENPLGKRITYNRGVSPEGRMEIGGSGSREIVGIVGNVKHLDLGDPDAPMFYTPQPHPPSFHTMTLVVRSTMPAESLVSLVSREIAAVDPEIPLYSVRSLREVVEGSVGEERLRARLLGLFAALALGLAVLGVYAVMGLAVVQREREIGIRMALGADPRSVVRMLVLESLRPVLWGLAAGGLAAVFITRSLRSLLYGIEPTDPATYAGVVGLLLAAALLAALVPTLRASSLDPAKTLRRE